MRARLVATVLSFAAAPLLAPLAAQGWIVPRPCLVPQQPPVCTDGFCRPVPLRRCPGPAAIERTSSVTRADLSGRVLRWEIDETFVNRGGMLAEADYVFPLPKGAAFEDLRLQIDGELVAGETMNADRARGIYEDIVRRQRDPALVEWIGNGLFRARIFPLEAGKERRVVVRFQSVAEREGDALRIDYVRPGAPQGGVGAPRVMPIEDAAGMRMRPGTSQIAENAIAFTITIPRDDHYGTPYSPTHRLTVRDRGDRRVVTAEGEARELTILIPQRKATSVSVSVLGTRPYPDSAGFALITVTPPSVAPRRVPRDVTFVLDVSGSMQGRKMEQARAAGRQLLETLGADDRFRLIDFSTDVRVFSPAPGRDGRQEFLPATSANLAAARRYLDALVAEGSTNISGALDEALATRVEQGRLGLVLFVTDGEPTIGERDPATIAAMTQRLRGARRLFTFGVGADVNAMLIEQLAVEGRGTASFVRPEESVERAVSVVASRLTTPLVADARVRVEGGGDVRLAQQLPAGPQDIFAGQDLVLLARYTGSGTVRIRVDGMTSTGPVSWTTDATFPERERENPFVARLWATQRIGWLSAERRRSGPNTELDTELRALGLRYGLPTELTSYLVTEPAARVTNAAGQPMSPSPTLQLQGVRVRGAAVAGAPPAPTAPGQTQFDAAKVASVRREARSLAEAEGPVNASELRRVGDRTFTLLDGVWTDGRIDGSVRVVHVKAYSRAWFDLVARFETLRAPLALGDRVRIAGKSVVLEVGPNGVETLGPRELEGEW